LLPFVRDDLRTLMIRSNNKQESEMSKRKTMPAAAAVAVKKSAIPADLSIPAFLKTNKPGTPVARAALIKQTVKSGMQRVNELREKRTGKKETALRVARETKASSTVNADAKKPLRDELNASIKAAADAEHKKALAFKAGRPQKEAPKTDTVKAPRPNQAERSAKRASRIDTVVAAMQKKGGVSNADQLKLLGGKRLNIGVLRDACAARGLKFSVVEHDGYKHYCAAKK